MMLILIFLKMMKKRKNVSNFENEIINRYGNCGKRIPDTEDDEQGANRPYWHGDMSVVE